MARDVNRRVEILGADDVARLPESTGGARERYTRILVCEGATRLIANANVEMRALAVGRDLWPVVLAEPRAHNADVCSPTTWYVRYSPAEIANQKGTLAGAAARARGLPMELLLKLGDIDRVVYVNNWLFATNPPHGLDEAAITESTTRLTELWPDRAIVFRSVNPALDRTGFQALRTAGYRFVRSRHVYLVDARDDRLVDHNNVRIDTKSLERTPYEVVDDAARLAPHAHRMTDLYRDIYLGKHVRHNPQLNEAFFTRTLSNGSLCYYGLVRDGRLDAFIAFLDVGNVLFSTVLGYDVTVARAAGLYRLLIALLIRDAIARRTILHLSSGAGEFKMLRGARPADELEAVYDAHLPTRRRLAWSALITASNRHLLDRSAVYEASRP